jgi:PKD repeat protein
LYDNNNALVQTIVKNDKSSVQFNPVNTNTTKIYTLYMVAKNLCGVINESARYPITIAAPITTALMSVSPLSAGNIPAGCAPYMATFHNLSAGGSSYVYNVYDSNFGIIESIVNNTTDDQNYTFTKPGTYYVTIGVFSNCIAGKESAKLKVVIYPIPAPDFTASSTTDCTQLTVNFTNNTPGDVNAPAVSYTYDWDFGDGNHSSDYAPTHTYDYKKSPYTVTLTATNNTGCTGIGVKTDYIIVHPPPGTDFTAMPDTITAIPNYHFDFQDRTNIQPISWFWDLGDGTTSTRQNPSHTYADTGKYVVKLTTVTQFGCTETKIHTVQITGVPGQLYVPNAFIPTSLSTELRTFTVKGSGIKSWSLRIFNTWGQMVFETSKLNSKGEPLEFWDGRFKGQDAQQGVYAWQISATFINGTEWKGMTYKGEAPKRAGTLNLIR